MQRKDKQISKLLRCKRYGRRKKYRERKDRNLGREERVSVIN